MKTILLKFRDGLIIGVGIITMFTVVNAAINLNVSSGESLTADKWNELVTKISGVYTDGLGNVGIGTTSPGAKLDISGTTSGTKAGGIRINPLGDADCWLYSGGNAQGCVEGGSELYRGTSGVLCVICN